MYKKEKWRQKKHIYIRIQLIEETWLVTMHAYTLPHWHGLMLQFIYTGNFIVFHCISQGIHHIIKIYCKKEKRKTKLASSLLRSEAASSGVIWELYMHEFVKTCYHVLFACFFKRSELGLVYFWKDEQISWSSIHIKGIAWIRARSRELEVDKVGWNAKKI